MARPVSLSCLKCSQVQTFVKGTPTQVVDMGQALSDWNDAELGTKHDQIILFAADHLPHLGRARIFDGKRKFRALI